MPLDEIKHGRDAILAAKLLPAILLLAACAQQPTAQSNVLVGKVWDTRAARFVPRAALFDRTANARYVILGEIHDNAEHHRLQRVVLESIAACFVARSFFDNVIGLERIVEGRTAELDARNRDMRLVLANHTEGLLDGLNEQAVRDLFAFLRISQPLND